MARRQEAAGVGGGAIWRGSWVPGAYQSGDDETVLLLSSSQGVVRSLTRHAKTIRNLS